jgi:hypothetical protein
LSGTFIWNFGAAVAEELRHALAVGDLRDVTAGHVLGDDADEGGADRPLVALGVGPADARAAPGGGLGVELHRPGAAGAAVTAGLGPVERAEVALVAVRDGGHVLEAQGARGDLGGLGLAAREVVVEASR